MGTIRRFEELEIWQIARKLSLKVFRLTETAPSSEDYKSDPRFGRFANG